MSPAAWRKSMKRYGASWKPRGPTKLSRLHLPASSTWSKSAELGTSTLPSDCTNECPPVTPSAQPLQHIPLCLIAIRAVELGGANVHRFCVDGPLRVEMKLLGRA